MSGNNKPRNTTRMGWSILVGVVVMTLWLGGCTSAAQPKTFTIGVVNLTPSMDSAWEGFKAGMAELGYVEGENVTYVYEGPTGSVDKLDAAAQQLVAADVDLILSMTTPATQAAKRATDGTDIPVVFVPVTDPVAAGLVQSLRLPGGNLTGITTGGSEEKRLQWQAELVPNLKKVYVPYNPDSSSKVSLAITQAAADKLGIELVLQVATTPDEVTAAIQAMPENVQAIFILSDGFMESQVDKWVETATQHGLSLSSTNLALVDKGVLLAYGHRPYTAGQQVARLAEQILKGTRPADLPVERAEFFLAVNLKTAGSIGLNIPDTVLRQAETIVR